MVEVEEILSEEQSEETSPNTRATVAIQLTDNDNDDGDGDGDVDKGRTARINTTTTHEDVVDDAEDHGWQELMGEDIMMKVMIRICCSNKEETHYNTARLSLLQLLSYILF